MSQKFDPEQAMAQALNFVLDHGRSKVSWDACDLIWDSMSLVSETSPGTSPDQVAVFGVKGQIIDKDNLPHPFQLRHAFDFGVGGAGYIMQATIGDLDDNRTRTGNFAVDRMSDDQAVKEFEHSVLQLTEMYKVKGQTETIKLFMTAALTNGKS